jgi:ubiquinone/menaquinone biosynthesis C-methylase UbiE
MTADLERGKWGTRSIVSAWDLPSLKVRRLMRALRVRERRDARLLEVGCGSGRILRSIRERDADLVLAGVDRDAVQIAAARDEHAGLAISYETADAERLPFGAGTFDIVIFLDYLEHTERPAVALAEMARVLEPGGLLHFVCPAEREALTPYRLSTLLFRRHFKEQTLGHIQQFTIADLERLTVAAGFTIVDVSYSYHALGATMDYLLFAALLHPRIARTYWEHDRYHATGREARPSLAGAALNAALTIGNAVAFAESRLLGRVRAFASTVHVTARRHD